MRPGLLVLAAVLAAGALAVPARAQSTPAYRPVYGPVNTYTGPYSVYGPGLTYRQPSTSTSPFFIGSPTFTSIRIATTVTVPDGGEALLGGYSRFSEGRNEFGAPVLGKVPYLGRGFRNVGYGREVRNTSVSVRARIIILSEEEERQTGVRP